MALILSGGKNKIHTSYVTITGVTSVNPKTVTLEASAPNIKNMFASVRIPDATQKEIDSVIFEVEGTTLTKLAHQGAADAYPSQIDLQLSGNSLTVSQSMSSAGQWSFLVGYTWVE